jgi:serine/threonine protein kinase
VRKRGFSQVTSSPSAQRAARRSDTGNNQDNRSRHRDAQFCTQRCLLGLQSGGALDDRCPNAMLHRRSKDDFQHQITSKDLVRLLKAQLDENIDRCTPLGGCGRYGAPFKLTCAIYGYTVIGKGTTSGLWEKVSREAEVYQMLLKAQGSAVPVFLGTIELAKIYSLHGAGKIRHMLVMGWGGESTALKELTPELLKEIHKSNKEIEALGIIHKDLRRDNVLWNEELGRALIIDFHRSTLKYRPTLQPPRALKRRLFQPETGDSKRLRVT